MALLVTTIFDARSTSYTDRLLAGRCTRREMLRADSTALSLAPS